MSIYFKPTYLYIKQHSVTGKLYFGKTASNDPIKYLGSGKHWKRHIKKHGKEHVITLWYELFTDIDQINEFATSFSRDLNIVNSTSWLNLIPENGLTGIPSGTKLFLGKHHSAETITRMSNAQLGKKLSEEHKSKLRKPKSAEHIRDHIAGENHPNYGKRYDDKVIICPHCKKSGGLMVMHRWHMDKCKFK